MTLSQSSSDMWTRNSSHTRDNDRWQEEQTYGRGRLHTKKPCRAESSGGNIRALKGQGHLVFTCACSSGPCLRHISLKSSMGSVMPPPPSLALLLCIQRPRSEPWGLPHPPNPSLGRRSFCPCSAGRPRDGAHLTWAAGRPGWGSGPLWMPAAASSGLLQETALGPGLRAGAP